MILTVIKTLKPDNNLAPLPIFCEVSYITKEIGDLSTVEVLRRFID